MNTFADRIEKILLLAALLALLGVAASRVESFDIFWQLQSGRHMLETGSFIYRDTFSLAADAPRWEHCWLHDIIFYGVFRLLGYPGISLLKGLLVAATGLALVAAARTRGSSWIAILLLTLPGVFMTRWAWLERPQLWTFLFFALFLLLLERFRAAGGRLVLPLFMLMALWANLHAGSVLAFPIMAAYLAGEGGEILLKRSCLAKGGYGKLWWAAAFLVLAALATPYGLQTLKTLFASPMAEETASLGHYFNLDWQKTTFQQNPWFYYALTASVGLMALAARRMLLTDLFLMAGLALMGFKLARHVPFFFFAAGALLPRYADGAAEALAGRLNESWRRTLRKVGLAGACGGCLFLVYSAWQMNGVFSLGLQEGKYPVKAAGFVKENRLPANLYNSYALGGYLMWELYPGYQVFFDGRQNSMDMFLQGLMVSSGNPKWQEILDKFEVKTIVISACNEYPGYRYPLIDKLRESPLWVPVFGDESTLVFVRQDAVAGDWLEVHRLEETEIDDTILSAAKHLTQRNPTAYEAYWEMTRIYWQRKQFEEAREVLTKYLSLAPQKNPQALRYYQFLSAWFKLKS